MHRVVYVRVCRYMWVWVRMKSVCAAPHSTTNTPHIVPSGRTWRLHRVERSLVRFHSRNLIPPSPLEATAPRTTSHELLHFEADPEGSGSTLWNPRSVTHERGATLQHHHRPVDRLFPSICPSVWTMRTKSRERVNRNIQFPTTGQPRMQNPSISIPFYSFPGCGLFLSNGLHMSHSFYFTVIVLFSSDTGSKLC